MGKLRAIVGSGGFGREVFHHIKSASQSECKFFVDDEYANQDALPISSLDVNEYDVVVAIGNPVARKAMVQKLEAMGATFFTYVDPSVINLDWNDVGEGSIICAGSILTTNITLGKHTHLNLHTTIGHDTVVGDYFTTAPGAKISGNCNIGECVYFGTNASVREKITICDNVTIGLNAGVVKNIVEPGTYVGVPAKKI